MDAIELLQEDVKTATSVEQSVERLINWTAAQFGKLANDPAGVQELATKLLALSDELALAIGSKGQPS